MVQDRGMKLTVITAYYRFSNFSDRSNAKWENTSNNRYFLLHYTVNYQNYKYLSDPSSHVCQFRVRSQNNRLSLLITALSGPLHCFASFNFKFKSTAKITGKSLYYRLFPAFWVIYPGTSGNGYHSLKSKTRLDESTRRLENSTQLDATWVDSTTRFDSIRLDST